MLRICLDLIVRFLIGGSCRAAYRVMNKCVLSAAKPTFTLK